MCLYSRLIKNPKYKSTKKNGGIIPPITDDRVKYVAIGCGDCIECRKQKAREWKTRLLEDIKTNKGGKFITLTFSDEWIYKIIKGYTNENGQRVKGVHDIYPGISGYILDNEIATRAMRQFNERWRKKYKKAIRHWMVTELGHRGTENIHMHGIVWTEMSRTDTYREVEKIWQYGHIWPREDRDRKNTWVNEATIGYMTKYVSKKDIKHKTYKSIILTSPGIGANYTKSPDAKKNKYTGTTTREYYRTRSGHKIAMPTYWRNKIYTEQEREKLWINKLDKEERWVCGEKVDIKHGTQILDELTEYYRRINKRLGYGDGERDYDREEYERNRREIMQKTRIAKGQNAITAI